MNLDLTSVVTLIRNSVGNPTPVLESVLISVRNSVYNSVWVSIHDLVWVSVSNLVWNSIREEANHEKS